MNVAVSKTPTYTVSCKEHKFPAPNRQSFGERQTVEKLLDYMKFFDKNRLIECFSDFNVLYFLATNPTTPLMV